MNAQVKKGVLKLCVLALLEGRDWYGYEISDYLTRLIDIADGSVYPLLRKMKSDGLLSTYLQEGERRAAEEVLLPDRPRSGNLEGREGGVFVLLAHSEQFAGGQNRRLKQNISRRSAGS